jgi:hypothetical protein
VVAEEEARHAATEENARVVVNSNIAMARPLNEPEGLRYLRSVAQSIWQSESGRLHALLDLLDK